MARTRAEQLQWEAERPQRLHRVRELARMFAPIQPTGSNDRLEQLRADLHRNTQLALHEAVAGNEQAYNSFLSQVREDMQSLEGYRSQITALLTQHDTAVHHQPSPQTQADEADVIQQLRQTVVRLSEVPKQEESTKSVFTVGVFLYLLEEAAKRGIDPNARKRQLYSRLIQFEYQSPLADFFFGYSDEVMRQYTEQIRRILSLFMGMPGPMRPPADVMTRLRRPLPPNGDPEEMDTSEDEDESEEAEDEEEAG